MKLLWTPKAKVGLEQTLNYLEENWTLRELSRFKERFYSVLKLIREPNELNRYVFEHSRILEKKVHNSKRKTIGLLNKEFLVLS